MKGEKKKNKPFREGTKFHLLLTGEGCKGVAAPPATHWRSARGARRLIYPVIYSLPGALAPAALGMLRVPHQSRRSGSIFGSRQRWALAGEVGGSGELPSPLEAVPDVTIKGERREGKKKKKGAREGETPPG